tara:strand:+ start:94 stop:738 length:645 start_codon:yes stop_codon:yes gene_type:complete
MDEEIAIIDSTTRNEKIKNFFVEYKKKLIIFFFIFILILFSYFIYGDLQKKNKKDLANRYNFLSINFISGNKMNIQKELISIIREKDQTYSPLALYFLIDNNIIKEKITINELFDILINETDLEREIRNLVIYKKGLFNSDFSSENELIGILNPLINSESVWKSHALNLLAEYFYFKNEKQKAKEFFEKILTVENGNSSLKIEARKKLNRDFSD